MPREKLYNQPCPIKPAKLNDVMKLARNYITEPDIQFYNNLSLGQVPQVIIENDNEESDYVDESDWNYTHKQKRI